MGRDVPCVKVTICRFVDASQPGWVECRLVDVHGRVWSFIDKVPIFSVDELDEESRYPCEGIIRCEVVARRLDVRGRGVVEIDTERPDGVAATSGETRFEVLAEQVIEGG